MSYRPRPRVFTRTAVLGLILATAAVLPALAQQPAANWIGHRSTEGGFTASFPKAPTLRTQEGVMKTGGRLLQFMTMAEEGNNAFIVGYFEIGAGHTFSLSEGRDGMLTAVKGTLLMETPITLRGSPGLDLTLMASDGATGFVIRARVFQTVKRAYVIQAIFPQTVSAGEMSEKTARFFNGFDIL